jgi:hypothetical protein
MSDRSGQQIVILTTTQWWKKLQERLAASKQTTHRVHKSQKIKRGREDTEQYRVEISNRVAVLEYLDSDVGINTA